MLSKPLATSLAVSAAAASAVIGAALPIGGGPALARPPHRAPLRILHPWSRPAPAGSPAAGYLTVVNTGHDSDRLLGGVSTWADKLEIHAVAVADGEAHMRRAARGVSIAPGQTVRLSPGGRHIMMIGLRRPLEAGDRVPVALYFEHAGWVKVRFHVERPPRRRTRSGRGRARR